MELQGEKEFREKTLSWCYFLHQEFHKNLRGLEPHPMQYTICEQNAAFTNLTVTTQSPVLPTSFDHLQRSLFDIVLHTASVFGLAVGLNGGQFI
jgi:hypothetical protein